MGWHGYGYRGYHGYGYGWGYPFSGCFGPTYGWGWGGWGFGVGWPYWSYGWNPWWYSPYGYAPGPPYNYYGASGDTGYNNQAPYDSYGSDDYDTQASYSIAPRVDTAALHFNINAGIGY